MTISIDKKIKIKIKPGETVLQAAKRNGIEIPALCYHPDLKIKANCRLCLVEIEGEKGLFPSCAIKAKEGMKIKTDSPKIRKARSINLGLIFNQQPELLAFAKRHKIKIAKFSPRKKDYSKDSFGPAITFDRGKCINCRNCLEACQKQEVSFYEILQKYTFNEVSLTRDIKKDCVYCGQCVVHCPVGALLAKNDIEKVKKSLADKNKITIAQFAPSIRTSIGEEFNLPYGRVVTDKLASAIRKLGFDLVFDTSVGADFTTFEEAEELMEKLEKKKTPCLSSCCPAWVKFIEFYYPEFVSSIATTRSPQVILGGLIKTYFAKKQKIDPKKIVVVSIMPCVAKKYEIERKELRIKKDIKPVDFVLTTRELAQMLKERKINLKKIKAQKADNPLAAPSGSGIIYGASGGVMEAVLRTVYYKATKKKLPRVIFKKVRGEEGIKKAVIKIKGKEIRIAVASPLDNAKKILDELKKNPEAYHGVEIMACPGGCIGGGGQPLPNNSKIRKKRAESLYLIDEKKKIKSAHENPVLKKVYQDFLTTKEKRHSLCHTFYSPKKREVYPAKKSRTLPRDKK